VTTTPTRSRATLTGISSLAWEHPADRGALVALRKLRGFDTILKGLSGLIRERRIRLDYLGGAIRVDDRQFAGMSRLLAEVARVLDTEELPELYVRNSPYTNAFCIGMNKPIIVVSSSLLDLLDEEEMRFVIAHELGHALSGHAVYRTLLMWLGNVTGFWRAIPIGGIGFRMIVAALTEWQRKSELSADRAGLLATQDPAVAYRVHMKLACGSGDLSELDQTAFFAQGNEYLAADDIRDSVLKLLLVEGRSHPYAVVRAAELRRWVESGQYTAILGGDYPRRADDDNAQMSEAAKQAADSYSEAFRTSQDALGKLVHDLAGVAGSAKLWLDDKLRRGGDADG
jgi:Zn-dependent protease with chaperone function